MNHVPMAPLVLDGWYVLHQFFRIDPLASPVRTDDPEQDAAEVDPELAEFAEQFGAWDDMGASGWSGAYQIVGGEADVMFVHFRPSLDELGQAERRLQALPAAARLITAGDYVSVVELGLYSLTRELLEDARSRGIEPGSGEWQELVDARLREEREKRYVQDRLRPTQPDDMPYVCFYPMDKRRNVGQNWYTLSIEDRARLMSEHGNTGRRYAGRISQIISGSVGLDDWEWGVTLFASDPLDLKSLVTEMRYDEVSALYAEFGHFRVGYRIPVTAIAAALDTGSWTGPAGG